MATTLPTPPSCVGTSAHDRAKLLREEERASWAVRDHPDSAAAWHALACVRANLELAGGIGREGPVMTAGDAWNFGAIKAAVRAIRIDARSPASELLGWLALEERPDDVEEEVLVALRHAVEAGSSSPNLLTGCAQVALERGDGALSRRCLRLGLASGHDSTFHLLRLARLAYREGDTHSGYDAFLLAAETLDSPRDREEIGWHLQWFMSPTELAAWIKLPVKDARAWVRDHLASRDIRDGRAPGTRLQEHFGRLEYVLTHFRLRLPRVAWKAGGIVGATPETGGGEEPDAVRQTCEPGTIPARPYRFYSRWQGAIDDRGVIWMRFGAPDERVAVAPQCPQGGPPSPNLREAWVYRLDGNQMLLQFENERFDGSAEATRLVTGVLGSYLCGIDAWRCGLTMRSASGAAPLPQEQLQRVIVSDAELVKIGTTKDDNSVRGAKPIRVVADLRRLWEPRSGLPISLVTWAARLDDLASESEGTSRTAAITVTVRRWARATGEWHDTTLDRRLTLPDTASGKRFLTGAFVLPGVEDATAWSVVLEQSDRRSGRAWDDEVTPQGGGALAVSDLVLGSPRQGLRWDAGPETIPLAPLGTVNRSAPATLFYQVRSDRAMSGTTTRISIYRDQKQGAGRKPVLQVSSGSSFSAGLNPVLREIDFGRLDQGRHRIEIEILAPNGRVLLTRSAPLVLE
ncbi:MAG: hypothetical protein IPP98_11900 [Gemmatimonadetes bacterium]|nr:hypothetical protein [Gemmatimonadota bacterium]